MSAIGRREFMAKLLSALKRDTLTARAVKNNQTSVVWLIGPPGPNLRKVVAEFADACDWGWRDDPADANRIGTWYWSYARAEVEPLLFDDDPLRGNLFLSAEERMKDLAETWAGVTLKFE
jgi:hypothetical protein